jgi:hypothetical protein
MLGHSLIDTEAVSDFLGLPDKQDDCSMDTLPYDEVISEEEMEGEEVSEIQTNYNGQFNGLEVITALATGQTKLVESSPNKSTLIATSILENGTVIYEPLTFSQEQSPAAMGCPTTNDQAAASSPLPPNTPTNFNDMQILQDIKMALHSQIISQVQSESTFIKELSQQPEVTIEPEVGTSTSITKELSHQPEVSLEPQTIRVTTSTKDLSPQSVIPIESQASTAVTATKELSQQPEVPIVPQVSKSTQVTKELSHQPEAIIGPLCTSDTKELSQGPEIITGHPAVSLFSEHSSLKPQDTINQNGEIVNNVPSQAKVLNESQIPNNNLSTPIKELSQDDTDKTDNDVITLLRPGFQVCTLEYNILPVVGTLYVVNSDHNLVKIIYEPDMVYQTDGKGTLYRIGSLKKPGI